jgi:hypothetical protein
VSAGVSRAAAAARAFCSSCRICLSVLLRRGCRALEGGDLKGRGGWGCGWPKSRASRLIEGVGVEVPETVGEGWAMSVKVVVTLGPEVRDASAFEGRVM